MARQPANAKPTISLYYAPDSYMLIDTSNKSWASCTLMRGKQERVLGSESLEWLIRRLLKGLTTWDTSISHSKHPGLDVEVEYALVLAPGYLSTLYVSKVGDCRLLLWQDPRGNLFSVMYLTPKQIANWCRQLDKVLRPSAPTKAQRIRKFL